MIAALALGLRFYQLGHENFWGDEVAYVQDASQSPYDIVDYAGAPRTRVHHVVALPHLLVHFLILKNPSERVARIPSAIFGSLEVLLVFVFACRLFSFHVGVLAALFLAVSPLHLWYSQEARWYAQWSFLTTCSYVALLFAWKHNRLSGWVAYGLTTLLNIYTFVYSGLVMAIQTISMFLSRFVRCQRKPVLPKYFATQVCVTAAALPIMWMILRGLDKSSGTPRSLGFADVPYTFFAYAAGFTVGPTLAELHGLPNLSEVIAKHQIILVFFVVFSTAVILGIRETMRDRTASVLLLPWLFGLPVLVFVMASVTNLSYQVRYTLPALPAFVQILALGVLSLKSKPGRMALMVGIVFCSLFSVSNFYWEPRYDKEHVRAALARVQAGNSAGAQIISIGQINRAVRYYGQGLNVVTVNKERCTDSGAVLQAGFTQPAETIWVIAGRDWKDRTAGCLEKLGHTYAIVGQQSFPGINLWLLAIRGK